MMNLCREVVPRSEQQQQKKITAMKALVDVTGWHLSCIDSERVVGQMLEKCRRTLDPKNNGRSFMTFQH